MEKRIVLVSFLKVDIFRFMKSVLKISFCFIKRIIHEK